METPPPRHLYLNPRTEGDITSPGTRTWRVGLRRGSCSAEVGHCTSWVKGRQGKAGPEAGGAGDAALLGVGPEARPPVLGREDPRRWPCSSWSPAQPRLTPSY